MFETFTFFWDGPFSQWHPSYFEVDGIEYNCAEQFMMSHKAALFGDEDAYERIMHAERPRTQKRLGRLVEGFEPFAWEAVQDHNDKPLCWNIVWIGNHAKFEQDAGLREALLETAGTTIVEASPEDNLWGIGLSEDDPRSRSRADWLGENWLGEVLTDLREYLLGGHSQGASALDHWPDERFEYPG